MTKYQEMCEAARTASRKSNAYRDSCYQLVGTFITALVDYCQIPPVQISYLRWNGLEGEASRYQAPQDGGKYTSFGAVQLLPDGFWEMGMNINLLNAGAIFFVVGFAVENDKSLVRIAKLGKPFAFDLENLQNNVTLFDLIVEEVKQTFAGAVSTKPTPKNIGFSAHLEEPPPSQ